MPKYLMSIPGVRASVRRPVVTEVVRDLMDWTGIDKTNTRIIYPGELDNAYQPGSTIDNQASFNQFESQRSVTVSVNEEIIEEQVLSISAMNRDHAEIFYDKDSKVFARPVYSPCIYSIEFTYRAEDIVAAEQWRDEIVARVATYRDLLMHQPKYNYVFPDEFFEVIKHVHELREAGPVPYGETLSEYIANHMTVRASVLVTGAGTEGRWAVSESQTRVLGWFDFGGVPDKPQRHADTSAHTITITYKFQMERPTAIVLELPVVINNSVIDQHFLQKAKTYTIPEIVSHASRSNTAMGIFEAGERVRYVQTRDFGLKIPEWLEFLPKTVPHFTRTVLLLLSTIDVAQPKQLLRLDQLGEYALKLNILEFLREEAPWLTTYGASIFHVSVYRNDNMISQSRIKVDNSLMVSLLDDPNPRDIHHVRLSMVMDPSILSKNALERLRGNALVLKELFEIIKPTPSGDVGFAGPGYAGSLTPQQYDKLVNGPDYGKHGVDWPAVDNNWKPEDNRDKNILEIVGKKYKVIWKCAKRCIPWNGKDETPPGSSSNGAVGKGDMDDLLNEIDNNTKPGRPGWNQQDNQRALRRVMGLFVQTPQAAASGHEVSAIPEFKHAVSDE